MNSAIYVSRTPDGLGKEIGEWAEGTCDRGAFVACAHPNLVTALRFLVVHERLARLRASQPEVDSAHVESMTLEETLISVWQQSLADGKEEVELGGEPFPVTVFRAKKLRSVEFQYGNLSIMGIEQNPKTASRWATLAREGNRIMQFRCKGRYVANVCEGKLLRYPAWTALALPD